MAANNEFAQLNKEMRTLFAAGVNQSYEARMKNLESIKLAINTYYDEACDALGADLGRSKTEASGELQAVMAEINLQMSNLKNWMEPEQKYTHMLLAPSHTEVRREPFGVVLVMSPFNYPMNLGLVPLVGAIAAGNLVVLKPSEQTTAVEEWYVKRFGSAVSRDVIRVVTGDIPRTTALLAQPWNFIFFTGSPTVGKIVSHAAADHLTPTVMELGGKAPVYVDASVGSINEAAKRIAFGKFINAGQTCMAPDYVLVHDSVHKQFVDALVKWTLEFYTHEPHNSEDFGRMCTEPHAKRSINLIETSGGVIKTGGHEMADAGKRYVPPTIIDTPSLDSALMKSEIFGPILPVLSVKNDQEAIKLIRQLDPQPLALYIFSTDNVVTEHLLGSLQSGDAMVNETFMHAINPDVPFGGVGNSGHGTYRGRLSFETFTYARGVLFRHSLFDIDQTLPFNVRFPPSGKARKLLLPHMIGLFPCIPRIFHFRPKLFALTAVFALAIGMVWGAEKAGAPPITYAMEQFNTLLKR